VFEEVSTFCGAEELADIFDGPPERVEIVAGFHAMIR